MAYQGGHPHSPSSAYGDESHRMNDLGHANVRVI